MVMYPLVYPLMYPFLREMYPMYPLGIYTRFLYVKRDTIIRLHIDRLKDDLVCIPSNHSNDTRTDRNYTQNDTLFWGVN